MHVIGTTAPVTPQEALHAIAVMAGVLAYCPRHETYYRGSEAPEATVTYYDRHLAELRKYFVSPVVFYTALIRIDNGKEFCGNVMVAWAHAHGVQLCLIESAKERH